MRIITCSKYNTRTDPIFKYLKILKIEDIFRINLLKFLYKYENNLLPEYFDNMFATHTLDHPYNTRNRDIIRPMPRTTSASETTRHHLPKFIATIPSQIKEKIFSHSIKGFTHYVKMFYLDSYSIICNIENCYVCNR